MADDPLIEPRWPGPASQRVRAAGQQIWLAALGAFVLGLAVAGWVGWRSGADFDQFLGLRTGVGTWNAAASSTDVSARQRGSDVSRESEQNAIRDEMALAGRVAAMEQRLDRVDLRVAAASGNAARAEALLVAFAVRRVVERGAPLGYLGDQLKLRFGDAQPHAVATIISGAKDVVPLDQLGARLEALAPRLTETGEQTLWRRVTRELADLLVVRRDRPAQSSADIRFDDARKALSDGRIDDAVADVQHLSTGADAANWSAAARRYRDVENALDLIDTTALLEPRQLHDGGGNSVNAVLQ